MSCVCGDTGYLLGQSYGNTDPPEGAMCIQRCDLCQVYEGDLEAAMAASEALGTSWGYHADKDGNIAYVGDEVDDFPGDPWVFVNEGSVK